MQCVDIMFTKLRGLQRLGRCCRSELKTATRTTDKLLLLVYAILLELKTATRIYDKYAVATCLRDTVVEIIGGVAFPGARGHFNYANLFFAKCFSLANSQTFDSRINNRLYGIPRQISRLEGNHRVPLPSC